MRKKWKKPELIRILRPKTEEAVLAGCKLGWPEPGSGSGNNDTHLKCLETCGIACFLYMAS